LNHTLIPHVNSLPAELIGAKRKQLKYISPPCDIKLKHKYTIFLVPTV
jgi:hypothetical protein